MYSIGIDLDSEVINIAILDNNKDIIDIKSFGIKDIKALTDVNQLYSQKKQKSIITSGLETQDILIKNMSFNVKKSFSLKKAVKLENEYITQIDSKKTISIPLILKKEAILKFFITTRDLLKKHLNRLNNLKIDPDYITCCATALCRYAYYYYNEIKDAFLIHIGQNKTSCVFMKNNMPEKTYSIKIGLKNLLDDLCENKKTKTSTFDVISLKHNTKSFEILNELKNEITKVFISFTNNTNSKYPLLVTGNIDLLQNLDKFLENKKTSCLLNNNKTHKTKSHAISIGLALTTFFNESQIIQFRKQEFTSDKKIINTGKKVFLFLTIFIFLITIFYTVSFSLLKNKENYIHENLIELQNFDKKQLNKSETTFSTNLYRDLAAYEKDLQIHTKEFAHFLKVPNVTQTLSWLNNHELLKNTEIISFNYELQKYPCIKAKLDPYVAKVELEFKTKTPSIARSFYDSLIQGEGLVNPNEEITWDPGNGLYKTSFYLKTFNSQK